MRRLRIGMAQINTTMGDFVGNRQKVLKTIGEAMSLGIAFFTFPELAICGYPPEELLFKPQFLAENLNKSFAAELEPYKRDTDALPPYKVIDLLPTAYVEEDKGIEQIIVMGIDEQEVKLTARLVDTSKYKQCQAPPGVKITPRAFGQDRRLPITNRFKGA